MKATHVRSITKNRNGVIIFRGDWERNTPDAVRRLKLLHAAIRPDAKKGHTYHLAYSHPVSDKQRKALEHGQRLRTVKGAADMIRSMQSRYAKELKMRAPNADYKLQCVLRILQEVEYELQRKGPL